MVQVPTSKPVTVLPETEQIVWVGSAPCQATVNPDVGTGSGVGANEQAGRVKECADALAVPDGNRKSRSLDWGNAVCRLNVVINTWSSHQASLRLADQRLPVPCTIVRLLKVVEPVDLKYSVAPCTAMLSVISANNEIPLPGCTAAIGV